MTSDAQFGIVRTLRPFAGFEAAYQGKSPLLNPIMLTEGGVALDEQAGQPGYDAKLLKGLTVPVGARVMLWLPKVFGVFGAPPSVYAYRWQLTWRLRNVADYRQTRTPYHLGQQRVGVPDAGSPRFVLPCVSETITYSETPEPAAILNSNSNLRNDVIRTVAGAVARPLIDPAGVTQGIYQQGVFDPAVSAAFAYTPIYAFYDTTAKGDELFIGVDRDVNPYPAGGAGGAQATWAFAAGEVDLIFSMLLGNGSGTTFPAVGIDVMCGSAP